MTEPVETTDLASLFTKDPREHTDDDLRKLIKALRENRSKFIVDGNAQAGNTSKLTAKEKQVQGIDLELKL